MGLFDSFGGDGFWGFPESKGPDIMETVEILDALLCDPKTEGKKDGYSKAAREYEHVFQDLKKEYDAAIQEINDKKSQYDRCFDFNIQMYKKLEAKRNSLQQQLDRTAQQLAKSHGISLDSVFSSFSSSSIMCNTQWDAIRFIADNKLRKRKEAEREGYIEARKLYEDKIKVLKERYNAAVAGANDALRKSFQLISNLLLDIENIKVKIADLELVLQED